MTSPTKRRQKIGYPVSRPLMRHLAQPVMNIPTIDVSGCRRRIVVTLLSNGLDKLLRLADLRSSGNGLPVAFPSLSMSGSMNQILEPVRS